METENWWKWKQKLSVGTECCTPWYRNDILTNAFSISSLVNIIYSRPHWLSISEQFLDIKGFFIRWIIVDRLTSKFKCVFRLNTAWERRSYWILEGFRPQIFIEKSCEITYAFLWFRRLLWFDIVELFFQSFFYWYYSQLVCHGEKSFSVFLFLQFVSFPGYNAKFSWCFWRDMFVT